MNTDETALRRDLQGARFKVGVLRKRWELVRIRFPLVWFRIPKPRDKAGPPHFLLRVDATDYPGALTAQLWDARDDKALAPELRPSGAAGPLQAFSNWSQCLYHPIDRLARSHWPGHPEPWPAGSDINDFLETVHGFIHDPTYLQSSAPAAGAELPAEPLETDPPAAA